MSASVGDSSIHVNHEHVYINIQAYLIIYIYTVYTKVVELECTTTCRISSFVPTRFLKRNCLIAIEDHLPLKDITYT